MSDVYNNFQTPIPVAEYMVSLIPYGVRTVLEPTPGHGNIVKCLSDYEVYAPFDYFTIPKSLKVDCVVMNPPFSDKYVFGMPDDWKEKGMKAGYRMLWECMDRTDNVIALMPWFLILDSTLRLTRLHEYGLRSITALPRSTFHYARIQCMIIHLQRGWGGSTEFRQFCFSKQGKKENQLELFIEQ